MSSHEFQEAIAAVITEFNTMHRKAKFEQSHKVLLGTSRVPDRFEAFASL